MSTEAAKKVVESIIDRASRMLVRYVVEVGMSDVVGDRDEDALRLIESLNEKNEEGARALRDLIGPGDRDAEESRWPLRFTSYNFLRPRYLLIPIADDTDRVLEEIETQIAGLAELTDDEGLVETARVLVSSQREESQRLRELAAEIGELTATPGHGRGTSASRW